jgi:hypothetical protein
VAAIGLVLGGVFGLEERITAETKKVLPEIYLSQSNGLL